MLRGHVRYACRDDYGTEPDEVSAWAGIHYFASRRGHAADADPGAVLTWPEGNGHLVGRMAARLKAHLTCGHIVHRVTPLPSGVRVECVDAGSGKGVAIVARTSPAASAVEPSKRSARSLAAWRDACARTMPSARRRKFSTSTTRSAIATAHNSPIVSGWTR